MAKFHGYIIDKEYVDSEGNLLWENTGNGQYIVGSKGETEYFIKRNTAFKCPKDLSSLIPALREEAQTNAKYLEEKQKKLHSLMGDVTFEKDHIVVEDENFWDYPEGFFVTVTKYIRGATDDYSAIAKEPSEVKLDIFLQMAGALEKLHKRNIIHGDLKESNFLFKKTSSKYSVYITDFDSTYTCDSVPALENGFPYSEGYQSPEIEYYLQSEDDKNAVLITPKTDVFSLGLIFHHLLTGSYIKTEKMMSLASNLLMNKSFEPKYGNLAKEIIGAECGTSYASLFNWMLEKEPTERASMSDVVKVLNDKITVPSKYSKDDLPAFDGLYSRHANLAIYDEDRLKEHGVVFFRKLKEHQTYKVKIGDNRSEEFSIEDLLKMGLLLKKETTVCSPWPEHEITFEPAKIIEEKGICSITREETYSHDSHEYKVVYTSGLTIHKSYERLILDGLASSTIEPSSTKFGDPWPEDSDEYVFASDKYFNEKSIENIKKFNDDGAHLYKVVYSNGKKTRLLDGQNMKRLGYLVLKRD